MRVSLVLPLFLIGCSATGGGDSFAPPAQGLQIKTDPYTLDAHTEKYFCYARTVETDEATVEVQVHAGAVVHHLAVFETLAPEPDGFSECPSLIKQTWIPIYGGGRSTPGLKLPAGAAFKFPAGTQMLVQLHLVNASDKPITETTAINLIYGSNPDSLTPAGIFAVGSTHFTIPTGATGFPVVSQCNMGKKTPLDVFALFPHMHRLGTSIRLEHGPSAATAEKVFEISPWTFGDQPMQLQTMTVQPGDFLRATCTYDNTDGKPVTYGESTYDEMCFVVLFYTPFDALGGCVN